jgi:16S rRNA (guanine(1405)-N(7))-methyltransferase
MTNNELCKQLDQLLEAVHASAKYKNVSIDVIRNIGLQELAKRSSLKQAIKATKNKLHQVGGAYLEGDVRYGAWLHDLKQAYQFGDEAGVRHVHMSIMSHHASMRERLPYLEQFYEVLLADLPPIRSVFDIACGLNPLAIPWMSLSEDTLYYAYDIYEDMVDFLNECMALMQVEGYAQARDVIHDCPSQKVDLAFLLKAIPCLEQVDKLAGSQLLERINADYLVVSFPAQSLGGRQKGMVENYEHRFYELVSDKDWSIRRFNFPSELVFLVRK